MSKPLNPGYRPGDRWAACERCGHDWRVSQMKEEWTGLLVCPECWEPRHPQDFVRAKTDNMAPTGPVSDEPGEDFVVTACSTRDAIAGIAEAGCALAGYSQSANIPSGTFNTNTL